MSDVSEAVRAEAAGQIEGELRAQLGEAFGRMQLFIGHDREREQTVDAALGVALRIVAPLLSGERVVHVVNEVAPPELVEEVELLRTMVEDEGSELVGTREVAVEAARRLRVLSGRHGQDSVAVDAREWLGALEGLAEQARSRRK